MTSPEPEAKPAPGGIRYRAALLLLATLRLVVPGDRRRRWAAEWRAELWLRAARKESLRPAFAAIPHAASLRWRHWSIEAMLNDIRFACRQVRSTPGLSLVVVLTLALGIGVNSLVYSVLSSTVLNPLPFDDADRIVYVWRKHPTNPWRMSPAMADVLEWREQIEGFESVTAVRGRTYSVTGLAAPFRLTAANVSPGFFGFLGVQPAMGRGFTSDEGVAGNDRVVVISHGLWRNEMGGGPDVIGRDLRLDQELYTVVGVMPENFRMQAPFALADAWTPLVESDATNGISAIAKLGQGVSLSQVNEELAALSRPDAPTGGTANWLADARRPADFLSDQYRRTLWSLQAAVGMVLLIAATNVVSLLLARGSARRQEMAVRAALGGSRSRLVRQLFTETMLLTICGGVLGLSLGAGGVRLLDAFRPAELSGLETLRLEPSIVAVTAVITMLAGLLTGLLPALQGAGDLAGQLAALSGRTSEGSGRRRARHVLVVAEVALSTVLVVVAGLLVSTFILLQGTDPGFRPDGVLSMRVSVAPQKYQSDAELTTLWNSIRQSVQTALGDRAESLTLSVGLPPETGVEFGDFFDDSGPVENGLSGITAAAWVDSAYFATLGIEWVEGPGFPDEPGDEFAVVVNREFGRQLWPGERSLGQRFRFSDSEGEPWRRVVGVVGDVKPFGLLSDGGARQIYYQLVTGHDAGNLGQDSLMLSIRTADDPIAIAATVRQAIWAIDAEVPITELSTLRERVVESIALPRFNAILMTCLAVIALGLALVGVYGVLSITVASRKRELGLRMALGASRAAVLALVGRSGATVIGLGLVIGIGAGAGTSRLLGSLLHGLPATDPKAYVLAALALAAMGVLATWLPAARATRVDPMVALRDD